MRRLIVVILLLLPSVALARQDNGRKEAHAMRVPADSIRVDGRLDDGSQLVTDGATSFTLSNRDFNVESFRSNLVLRWEWRAGSTLYLNFFAIKTTFWVSPG